MPTRTTDKIATSGDGIDFNPGETWTIDPGIIVYSPAQFGVRSDLSGSTLVNAGIVDRVAVPALAFLAMVKLFPTAPAATLLAVQSE